MKRFALSFALAIAAAVPAAANPSCAPGDARPVPAFNTLESALLSGDFAGFFAKADGLGLSVGADQSRQLVERLHVLVPEGFSHCQVMLQRADTGGTVPRISVFYARGKRFPIYLYQVALPDGDTLWLNRFLLQTTLSKITAELF